MSALFSGGVSFGVLLTLAAYVLGVWLQKKTGKSWCNPLLIAVVLIMLLLCATGISYDGYYLGAQYIGYLMTPATVCLAVPLYRRIQLLKNNWKAILLGTLAGVVVSLATVMAVAFLFRLSRADYVTLLPRSVTSAIGKALSDELGGISTLTVAVIILTGLVGNLLGQWLCKLFRITEPVAQGVAYGVASHAVGTAKALQVGEIQGAMSSLAIISSGVLTVILAPLCAMLPL